MPSQPKYHKSKPNLQHHHKILPTSAVHLACIIVHNFLCVLAILYDILSSVATATKNNVCPTPCSVLMFEEDVCDKIK